MDDNPIGIIATGSYLPATVVDNDEVGAAAGVTAVPRRPARNAPIASGRSWRSTIPRGFERAESPSC